MAKVLAVFGATGQQGGSVIEFVLNDPELSKQYQLRAITRDVTSKSAQTLKGKNVEVVEGDSSQPASLDTALAGAHTVFAMTVPSFTPDGEQVEYASGKVIADAAVAQGAKYIIFSTLPHVSELSGGKYTNAIHCDAKAKIEQYIRGLPIKSAFVALGMYISNYYHLPFFAPQETADGSYVMARSNSPKAKFPMVNAEGDTGKFVGAILAQPENYKGKVFLAATAMYDTDEVAAAMSKATGKTVVYKQISLDAWKATLPFAQDIFGDTFSAMEEFGYCGAETESLLAWSVQNARGKLTTVEEYLKENPLPLA
ncbi:Hypothetical protein R9X50_00758200 [Acrodontium crateriforme]|uniref:NmrA-like domain-containing protein n=1 Tax=Acrodontium crateriforme TaxID=150365 RepID=A0AAQ3MBB7_9PEZI|nr:Hypothetical protein R9X50_00758200 [Acrodontium crateriforme]